jgi:cytochrome c-type biogenesis protein CcmF
VALGIIGNEFYQSEGQANLQQGQSITVANYTLTYRGLDEQQGPNYIEYTAPMTLARNGQPIGEILPKKHIYFKNQEQPMTEVGLRPGAIEDVYVVLAGFEEGGASASFKVYVNPLMSWMWIGGLVVIAGVLISAWPRKAPGAVEATARVPRSAQTT